MEQMTDRELLEFAAKAAGYKIEWVRNSGCHYRCEEEIGREPWCPLDSDGDALRLAVALHLDISVDIDGALVEMQVKDDNAWASEFAHDGDIYAATRRAIVRAAAAIGQSMP